MITGTFDKMLPWAFVRSSNTHALDQLERGWMAIKILTFRCQPGADDSLIMQPNWDALLHGHDLPFIAKHIF